MKKTLSCLVLLVPLACAESPTRADNTGGMQSTDPATSGGQVNTGGTGGVASNAGGASVNGGAMASGGSVATGGNTNGNSIATGGSTNANSTSPPYTYSECNLPDTATSGVAKPAGTPGNLKVLNWAGFKGAVSYTFDDANSSQIAHYADLQALGVRMTFYMLTGKTEAANAIWKQAVLDGHELGNHTKSHAQTATAEDIDAATAFLLSQYGVKAATMAAPYGNSTYAPLAQTRFIINRGVSNALIAPNGSADPFNLPCFIPAAGALASVFNAQVDTAAAAGAWRVMLVHGFEGGTDGAYLPVNIAEFTAHVAYAKSLGTLWADSVVNVGAYWRAQKMFSATSPTTSGSNTTWTWTLPDNFPVGKCLRVAVDGGTLLQSGNALTWDDHGYYEVALDAGSLTLSP